MSDPEPSPGMRSRFLEALEAYREGYEDAQRRLAASIPKRRWFWHPAWQAAFATLLLAAGGLGGRYLLSRGAPPSNPEIARLQGQVDSLRQMVALSLLREDSPAMRMRGTTYGYQMAQPDREVVQALLHTVNHDTNVNVRLSAVDALAKFTDTAEVRRALSDSLSVQDSPLVEMELIDVLAQARAPEAIPAMLKLSEDKETNDAVRQRAAAALEKLGGKQ